MTSGRAAAYLSATMRNAEVLLAMGMWRPLRDRWLDRQREVLDLQALAAQDLAEAA